MKQTGLWTFALISVLPGTSLHGVGVHSGDLGGKHRRRCCGILWHLTASYYLGPPSCSCAASSSGFVYDISMHLPCPCPLYAPVWDMWGLALARLIFESDILSTCGESIWKAFTVTISGTAERHALSSRRRHRQRDGDCPCPQARCGVAPRDCVRSRHGPGTVGLEFPTMASRPRPLHATKLRACALTLRPHYSLPIPPLRHCLLFYGVHHLH
jgi:hypothetical protein